jgi:hypothetical protein
MSRLTGNFKAEFETALALEHTLPYNEVLQGCLSVLKAHQLLYTLDKVGADQFLVHRKNRGTLMLSPHNVHKNAETIYTVGADRKQLNNAVCIELSPSGPNREEHLQKNGDLVRRAKGLIAEITGAERFVTVGCGHTTGFCKLAKAGGRTSSKKLSDERGMIDCHKICKNSEFKAMIEEGWTWTVVPFEIDEQYPVFAHIAQKALNSSNHVAQHTGELEVAIYLANIINDEGFQGVEGWQDDAVQQITELCAPCSSYARTILSFVCDYGGGSDASGIHFMDAVAKQFHASNVLGETFWKAVTAATFHDKTKMFPLLRVALMLVNLTSDKVEDGIAKLLSKSDVSKLTQKGKAHAVLECEDALVTAQRLSNVLIEQHPARYSQSASLEPLGQFSVRVGLYATGRGAAGPEKKEHTLQQIKDLYLAHVSKIVDIEVKFPPWQAGGDKSAATAAAPAAAASSTAATLADHNSPLWIAQKAGFHVGGTIYEKLDTQVNVERCYHILSINDDKKVTLIAISGYDGTYKQVDITMETLCGKRPS